MLEIRKFSHNHEFLQRLFLLGRSPEHRSPAVCRFVLVGYQPFCFFWWFRIGAASALCNPEAPPG